MLICSDNKLSPRQQHDCGRAYMRRLNKRNKSWTVPKKKICLPENLIEINPPQLLIY